MEPLHWISPVKWGISLRRAMKSEDFPQPTVPIIALIDLGLILKLIPLSVGFSYSFFHLAV